MITFKFVFPPSISEKQKTTKQIRQHARKKTEKGNVLITTQKLKGMETKNFEKFTSTQTKVTKIKTIQTFFPESIDFFLLIQLL